MGNTSNLSPTILKDQHFWDVPRQWRLYEKLWREGFKCSGNFWTDVVVTMAQLQWSLAIHVWAELSNAVMCPYPSHQSRYCKVQFLSLIIYKSYLIYISDLSMWGKASNFDVWKLWNLLGMRWHQIKLKISIIL